MPRRPEYETEDDNKTDTANPTSVAFVPSASSGEVVYLPPMEFAITLLAGHHANRRGCRMIVYNWHRRRGPVGAPQRVVAGLA